MSGRHYDIETNDLLDAAPAGGAAWPVGWYWVAEYDKPPVIAHYGYVPRTGTYGWHVCGNDVFWSDNHWYFRSAKPLPIPAKPYSALR